MKNMFDKKFNLNLNKPLALHRMSPSLMGKSLTVSTFEIHRTMALRWFTLVCYTMDGTL